MRSEPHAPRETSRAHGTSGVYAPLVLAFISRVGSSSLRNLVSPSIVSPRPAIIARAFRLTLITRMRLWSAALRLLLFVFVVRHRILCRYEKQIRYPHFMRKEASSTNATFAIYLLCYT